LFIAHDDIGVQAAYFSPDKSIMKSKHHAAAKRSRTKCFKKPRNAEGNIIGKRTLAKKDKLASTTLLSDQRGAVAFEMLIVWLFMTMGLLLPLSDLAIAGFKFISAQQALRDMAQRTQYNPPADVTTSSGIGSWTDSLPTTVAGFPITAKVYCGNPGTLAPCAPDPPGTASPKYYTFSTSFTLSPMVLGSYLCSTCTANYSQPFQ